MKELIDVFQMIEIKAKTRAKIIIKLGDAINNRYGASITEPVVFELVDILDPENDIFEDKEFMKRANK